MTNERKLTPEQESRKEKLLDQLIDFLNEVDEFNYDEAKHDEILAKLNEIDPMPPITNKEESYAKFIEKYKHLFEE